MAVIQHEVLVIGAGVVGLAIAKRFAEAGHKTLILEKQDSYGREASSHNSGVIHAGIYYEADTLKAKLCGPEISAL